MILDKITKEQEERLLLYATYTILYLNDTACFTIQQLCTHVPENKESKKIYGALLKRGNEYLNKINTVVDNKMDYYCDYCTEMDEITNEAYFAFKKSLQKAYATLNLDNCEYFSMVETMRAMVDLAVEAGRKVIASIHDVVPKSKWLECYLLVDMQRVANNFATWEYRKIPKDMIVNFNQDKEVMDCLKELSKCLISYNSFDKAYRNAIELENERNN